MSVYFQIGELFFYPNKNEIHCQKEIRKVRPKTAELLTVLLDANGEIVSKSTLLKQVWDDVIVEDHVVFQSIAEIRKLLDDASFIKTHPRKGYSVAVNILVHSNPEPVELEQRSVFKKATKFVGAIAIVTMLYIGVFYNPINASKQLMPSGSIIVLPVKNHIADSAHSWIKYGGMDLLIKHLKPQMDLTVLQTEDVLEIIKRAGVNIDELDDAAVERILEISGAELIVEQSISGSTRDYQLVYSFHNRTEAKRGALFSDNAESIFIDLNAHILSYTGNDNIGNHNINYKNDFTNELIAKAMDNLQAERYNEAATLLKAVIVTEPKNLTAYKILSQVLNYTGSLEDAESVSSKGILLASQQNNESKMVRIMFWHALSLTQQHKYKQALIILEAAKKKAKTVNDVLYIANISKISGKIHLSQEMFVAAETDFLEALNSHNTIQCPFGRSNTLIDLGEVAYQSNEITKAEHFFKKALGIAQDSHLNNTIVLAEEWLDKIK
jgi:DNA-binding winged helix-turn-helix (wHTH) protein/tetratricopeptide (TPR) repeat protein